ncbi:ATP-binding protein [Paraglaciecola aquimarina]|uniref:histidine kinase n=1 Tax=Paraglaciecola algarum TaxID=3050085 RepID=A0ABS9D8P8_9ALTE|nr:ATP-binding protein [Paraglaciecola sp. G1-23]MCF2948750.1 ATP-binding protein [Paraglaciecola sp. G1-23]
MARLFISLYIFITIALIGLSAGLEKLFIVSEDLPSSTSYVSFIQAAHKQNANIENFLSELNLNYQTKFIKDFAWSQDNLTKLHQGKILTFFDPQVGEQLYLKISPQQLLEISLPEYQSSSQQFFIYSVVFFLCLGGVIALWIWPLWRDLSRLQKTVSEVLPDGSIAPNTISNTSLIAPIAIAINDMRSQINELIQNQRELSGAVAHEFRTPLARLKFSLAMQPQTPNAPWLEMQQDINELERLVQEMLDYASSNVQIPEMNWTEIPVKKLCTKIIQRLENSHLQGINTEINGDDIHALADEHFMERAVSNLIVNASRYANKQLHINLYKNPSNIEICIEDDGKGIAPDIREKIFSPFFRPDESRNRTKGGAGLGLAIVKRIIDWHKGKCFVTDSKLGGAKFVIQLKDTFNS